MWNLCSEDEYLHRRKKWPKKYKRELLAMHDNLDTYLKALNSGQHPSAVEFGFLHHEPMGIRAIDQKGGGAHLKESRLYVYADLTTQNLHLMTLGDKEANSQSDDIAKCKEFVKELLADRTEPSTPTQREKTHVQE